jgi:hypothetical protein
MKVKESDNLFGRLGGDVVESRRVIQYNAPSVANLDV